MASSSSSDSEEYDPFTSEPIESELSPNAAAFEHSGMASTDANVPLMKALPERQPSPSYDHKHGEKRKRSPPFKAPPFKAPPKAPPFKAPPLSKAPPNSQ